MRTFVRSFMLAVLAVTLMASSGCLSTVGSPKRVWDYDTPDPAAESLPGGFQVFTTNNASGFKVPSFTVDWVTKQSVYPREALETRPWWSPVVANGPVRDAKGPEFVWAPTVRFVAGRYLMMFTASVGQHERAACIGLATASSVVGPYKSTMDAFCDPNPKVAWIDPQLYREGADTWLVWSRQWAPASSSSAGPAGGSDILIQKLSSNGLTLVGSPRTLITFTQANLISPLSSAERRDAFVENPSLVKDPYNGYDLLVSFGDYHSASYRTLEVPCILKDGNCLPSEGANISPLLEVSNATGEAGASLMFDGTPNSNIVVFHARPTSSPGQRWSYAQDTSSINRNPNTAFFKQDGTVIQAAVDGAALPIQAPQTVNPPARVVLNNRCPTCSGGRTKI